VSFLRVCLRCFFCPASTKGFISITRSDACFRYTSLGSTYNTFPNPALLVQPSCSTAAITTNGNAANELIPPPTQALPMTPNPASSLTTSGPIAISPATSAVMPSRPILDTELPLDAQEQQFKTEQPRYRPAYELLDGSLEREGRGSYPGLVVNLASSEASLEARSGSV
jgi:FAD synthetase